MKISTYTDTRNCIQMDYPFRECIASVLQFSDEVVVVDSSDGTDLTLSVLEEMAADDDRIKVYHLDLDWKSTNHALNHGYIRDFGRSKCSGDFLWQTDVDEIVHESDAPKIVKLAKKFPSEFDVIALPVIEFWGDEGKVRVDVNAWKWRFSRNTPNITQGIPAGIIQYGKGPDGKQTKFVRHGTDGCNYIIRSTGSPAPFWNFVTPISEQFRKASVYDAGAAVEYQKWFQGMIHQLPSVYHYSWFSLERKIRQYKLFWTEYWKSLYNEHDNGQKNPFFEVPWSEVTEGMIKSKAKELKTNCGGWIFHQPWPGIRTNAITPTLNHPAVMRKWIEQHHDE